MIDDGPVLIDWLTMRIFIRQSLAVLLVVGLLDSSNALVDSNFSTKKVELDSLVARRSEVGGTRRQALAFGLATLLLQSEVANAFDNKISNKYDDRPKRRGPMPKDLGVGKRTSLEGDEYIGLKTCGAAPNCFSSTNSVDEDPDHSIPAFVWPKDLTTQQQAFEQLQQVVQAYPPGQNGVDGGGFQIQKFDPQKGYMYVQFEALKNGYIDDVEFAFIDGFGDRNVQVRSSSRIGYLDLGVNAKRLNWIAKALRDKGWNAVGVDFDTHRGYAIENQI